MRLLLIIPRLVSYGFLRELCLDLTGSGSEVHLAVSSDQEMSDGGAAERDGMILHPIDFPRGFHPLGHLRAAGQLRQLVQRLRPDVVHAHFSTTIFTTALAHRPSWPPTLGTFHGASFPIVGGVKGRILRFAESWSASRVKNIWVLTDDDREALRATAPRALVNTHQSAGIGVDLARFDRAAIPETTRAELRARLGLTPAHRVAVFVGRFVDFKGFGLTVRAFLQLAKSEPDLRLLLVGDADGLHPTGLTPEEAAAWKSCPAIIDAGYQPEPAPFVSLADFMVFPSQREGMPVCLMEALALGVPVITNDARGCRDVVRDGVDGLVLRDASASALSGAIRRLAADEPLRQRLAAAALAGRARLDRRHFIREQREIYASLMDGDQPPASAGRGLPVTGHGARYESGRGTPHFSLELDFWRPRPATHASSPGPAARLGACRFRTIR